MVMQANITSWWINMRIFIWVQYGDAEAYDASTTEQAQGLYNKVVDAARNFGINPAIAETEAFINQHKPFTDSKTYRAAVNRLLQEIEVGSHESFEHGTGFTNLQ